MSLALEGSIPSAAYLQSTEQAHNEEFCPACGNFVNHIDADTGWCLVCSGDTQTTCIGCGNLFTKDAPHRKLCGWCREERWLLRHANEIEEYMLAGATLKFARREVYYNNRPVCVSCNQPIPLATNGANFCTRTIACRRWRRRYRTVREQNIRKEIIDPAKMALSQVSAEIFAQSHTMEIGG